jgi:transcription initiation factor TFIID TATA-box-binding protein
MTSVRFENVVASMAFGAELDLPKIAVDLEGSEYAPDRFPGLIYRLKEPKTAVLLFHSGKGVCTGGKSWAQADFAVRKVSKIIRKLNSRVLTHPILRIENIVATASLGAELNLNSTAVTLGLDHVEYEPEQFPGVVYRMEEPRVVLLLFKSGKVVCTGAHRPSDVLLGVKNIIAELRNAGLLGQGRNPEPVVVESALLKAPGSIDPPGVPVHPRVVPSFA